MVLSPKECSALLKYLLLLNISFVYFTNIFLYTCSLLSDENIENTTLEGLIVQMHQTFNKVDYYNGILFIFN